MSKKNPRCGSALDDFPGKEDIYEAAKTEAALRLEALRAEIKKGIESGGPSPLDMDAIKARCRYRLEITDA